MGTQDLPDLTRRLELHRPESLLAIGPRAGALAAAYLSAHPDCRIEHLDTRGTLGGERLLKVLARHGRFDFIIVRGVLERVDADTGAHLIARLRDMHSRRFCVVLPVNGGEHRWQSSELIAMGLAHWSRETVKGSVLEVYGFDLGTYKATPDWLNARHWAHPEQWGKNRW
ncbi:MAG: hypothetical protein E2O65_06535 [Gammaproteobacteria bacterium]|nr:MAG: hypothetical protein E2O65_06535 [Gammaproteobacteria bacterium]